MKSLIERFTLECRTNKTTKLKKFKLNYVNKGYISFGKQILM